MHGLNDCLNGLVIAHQGTVDYRVIVTLPFMEQEFCLSTGLNEFLTEDFGLLRRDDLVISAMNKQDGWQKSPKLAISSKQNARRSTISKCLSVAQDEALQESIDAFLVQMSHEAMVKLIDATQSDETDKISDRPSCLGTTSAQRNRPHALSVQPLSKLLALSKWKSLHVFDALSRGIAKYFKALLKALQSRVILQRHGRGVLREIRLVRAYPHVTASPFVEEQRSSKALPGAGESHFSVTLCRAPRLNSTLGHM